MHASIRRLTSWTPLHDPAEGCTVVVGCMRSLAPLALANLRFLEQAEADDIREIILVFDCVERELPPAISQAASKWRAGPPLRIICYTPRQAAVAAQINWGWVYSWLSWCIGVGAASTRHVLLHDLVAFPIGPGFLQRQYRRARESGAQFTGVRRYTGSGIDESMNLVTTFEMVLDAEHVRRSFRPFDAFNQIRIVDGRYVDFDTFLHVQRQSPSRVVAPISENQLVHPSQLICNYTDLIAGRSGLASRNHNLMLLPYFSHIGADSDHLRSVTRQLDDGAADIIELFGKPLPIGRIAPTHWAWMEKQIRRMEQALNGRTSEIVEAHLSHFARRAGDARTVGRESGATAVPIL